MLTTLALRVRLLLTVLVPTAALVMVVSYGAVARSGEATAARAELARTQALERLAAVQSFAVLPEGAAVTSLARNVDSNPLHQLVLSGFWHDFAGNYLGADDARRQLTGPARAQIDDATWAAFEQQRTTSEALVAAVTAGGVVDPALISSAEAARREADLALTDLSQASASDAWITYMGSIDAMRAGQVEFASLFPSLAGVPVATADELAQLAGERANATERVVLGLPPALRVQVGDVLASDDNIRWTTAVARGQAVAAGREPPLGLADLSDLARRAVGLQGRIMQIASEAVAQVRADLTASADRAERQRWQLIGFGGGFALVTLLLTGWILRSITSPLRRLTQRVAAVADGQFDGERVTIRGHDELARLGATIEDVADGLRHLERQIRAMVDGDLDDPSLGMSVPGPVGAYVQQRLDDLRQASGQLRAEASSDPLTGLLNRRALADAVQRRSPRSDDLTLMYLDLDRFKLVNDHHGHRHGDAVLQTVAARLTGLVRQGDLVARVGGDEFVLVLGGLEPDTAVVLASRVELAVTEPIVVEGATHVVGCSVGVATLGPGDDLTLMLEEADQRMLGVKVRRQGSLRP